MVLLVQVEKEHSLEIHSEFVYYETLIAYEERVLDRAAYIIDKQSAIIGYQRNLIGKLGRSPCVERVWLMLR